jgi:hypothetical protein
MKNFIINNSSTTPDAAADGPQPQMPLAPDAAIEQIRSFRAQLPAVTTLTAKQRKGGLRNRSETSEPIVQASLNVIGVSDVVSSAIGLPIENVRTLQQEAILWKAVEEETRNLLAGLAGANALRRQKLAELGQQAYNIGTQVAKVPENEVLVSHVEEIKRLKKLARRKKSAISPTSSTPSAPSPNTEVESKA